MKIERNQLDDIMIPHLERVCSPRQPVFRGKVVCQAGDAAQEGNQTGTAVLPSLSLEHRRWAETQMRLRCTDGTLALVIHDTRRCVRNIGRVVQVRGPVQVNRCLRLPCWLVKPVTRAPYAVEYGRKLVAAPVYWKNRAEHPDAWLLPLEGMDLAQEAAADAREAGIFIKPVDWDAKLEELLQRYP